MQSYPISLHDALPISQGPGRAEGRAGRAAAGGGGPCPAGGRGGRVRVRRRGHRDQRQDGAPAPARVRRGQLRRCRGADPQLGGDQARRTRRRRRAGRLGAGRHLPRPAGMAAGGEAAVARRAHRLRLAGSGAGAGEAAGGDRRGARRVRTRRRGRQPRSPGGRDRRPAVRGRQCRPPRQGRSGRRAAPGQPQVRAPLPRDGSAGRGRGHAAADAFAGAAGSAVAAGQAGRTRGRGGGVTTFALFVATAIAEILGCWLVWSWLRNHGSAWLLLPAALSLAVFAWLLTLHPTATGRVYAAYGGVYIGTALAWLWAVDGVRPTRWDLLGVGLCLAGMAVIMFAPRQA